jgi:hypothetical protein
MDNSLKSFEIFRGTLLFKLMIPSMKYKFLILASILTLLFS